MHQREVARIVHWCEKLHRRMDGGESISRANGVGIAKDVVVGAARGEVAIRVKRGIKAIS